MLSLYLASRLSLSPSRGGRSARSGIVVSVTGIALAIVVMMLSISVMTGFRSEIRSKIMGFDAQLSVARKGVPGEPPPTVSLAQVSHILRLLPDGARASLAMRQPAILKTSENFTGVIIKAADPGADTTFIASHLVEGVIPDYGADSTLYHIVISSSLARRLDTRLGEKLDTYFLGDGVYRARRLKVAGIYDTHFTDYDNQVVFASLPMMRQVSAIPEGRAPYIEISGIGDDRTIDATADSISSALMHDLLSDPSRPAYAVSNIHDTAAIYFNWLSLLDTNVAVILVIMALLSSLTLVSSLFILILRRVTTIGILKALGAGNALVRRIFVIMTLRILLIGVLAGNAIALAVILIQCATAIIPLDPETYYLDHVPMAFDPGAWLAVNAAVILLSAAILLLPSSVIATIPPSKAINYE